MRYDKKTEKLIDLVLDNYEVESTPQVRAMVKDFISCDLAWFDENFVEEQEQVEKEIEAEEDKEYRDCGYDEDEQYAYCTPHDQSICGKSDHFSYYDNCIR